MENRRGRMGNPVKLTCLCYVIMVKVYIDSKVNNDFVTVIVRGPPVVIHNVDTYMVSL